MEQPARRRDRRRLLITLAFAGLVAVGAGPTMAAEGSAFHVAPWGDDDNDGSPARPFRTLEQARDAMRRSAIDTTVLRGGVYAQGTIRLDDRDDGVTFKAFPGETPHVSGGERITGWRHEGGGVFSAAVDFRPGYTGTIGRQPLRPADARASGAHEIDLMFTALPGSRGGDARADRPATIRFDPAEIGPGDIAVGDRIYAFTMYDWTNHHGAIASIDWRGRTITTDGGVAHRGFNQRANGGAFRIIHNARDVDEIGELGVDASSGRLHVKPADPDLLARDGALIARHDQVFVLDDADDVTLDGLIISDAFIDRGDKQRSTGQGTGILARNGSDRLTVTNTMIMSVAVAVDLTGSSHARLANNIFGLNLLAGISLYARSGHNEITNNYFDPYQGWLTQQKLAIRGNGGDNHIHHNAIHGSTMIGVSNEAESRLSDMNLFEYNKMLATDYTNHDWGVFYTIAARGSHPIKDHYFSKFQYNVVGNSDFRFIDKNGVTRAVDTDVAIYFDNHDALNNMVAHGNLVHGQDRTFVIHGGDDITITNNIVLLEDSPLEHHGDDARGEAFLHVQTQYAYDDKPARNLIERNIVLANGSLDYVSLSSPGDYTLDRNLLVGVVEASPAGQDTASIRVTESGFDPRWHWSGPEPDRLGIEPIARHLGRAGLSNPSDVGPSGLQPAITATTDTD